MNPDIQQIQTQIDNLQKKLNNLYASSTIERNVETALTERLAIPAVKTTTDTVANTTISAFSFNLAVPTGVLTVVYNGTTYKLLYQ